MKEAVKWVGQGQASESGVVRTVSQRWQIGGPQIEPAPDDRLGEALARLSQLQEEVKRLRGALLRAEHELRREQVLVKNARQREFELRAELLDALGAGQHPSQTGNTTNQVASS